MKTKILSIAACSTFLLASTNLIAQLNIGATSATKVATTVNTTAVSNAVSKSAQASAQVANTAVTKTAQVSNTAVTKATNTAPIVSANAAVQASGSSTASHGDDTKLNSTGNSNVTVEGDVNTKNTTTAVNDTKTTVKKDAHTAAAKAKSKVSKAAESRPGASVSSKTEIKGQVK